MLFLTYISFLAIALIIGGLFCMGLWYSSLGEDSVKPNGETTTDWAMIFYPVRKFLDRKKEEVIYYSGEQLHSLIEKIKCDYRQYGEMVEGVKITEHGFEVVGDKKEEYTKLWHLTFCDLYKKYNGAEYTEENNVFSFFKTFEKPIISEYISKPILLCFKCYASIWGSLIFWSAHSIAVDTGFIQRNWSIDIPMWIFYCFALVTVNIYFEKKTR